MSSQSEFCHTYTLFGQKMACPAIISSSASLALVLAHSYKIKEIDNTITFTIFSAGKANDNDIHVSFHCMDPFFLSSCFFLLSLLCCHVITTTADTA